MLLAQLGRPTLSHAGALAQLLQRLGWSGTSQIHAAAGPTAPTDGSSAADGGRTAALQCSPSDAAAATPRRLPLRPLALSRLPRTSSWQSLSLLPITRGFAGMAGPTPAAASDSESDSGPDGLPSPEEWRRSHAMEVAGADPPDPFQTFEQTGFPRELLTTFKRAGYKAPTFIQAQAWPIAMQGRDLVAIASTGSGKTCGFLAPSFLHIQERMQAARAERRMPRGPYVLVLAPTRELAQQIKHEADTLGRGMRISNACLYGGASKGPQGRDLRRYPGIVIATPGRLLDFVESREVDLSDVSYLVLDEADRMLDMGFEPQIREIVENMTLARDDADSASDAPPPRQTLFFSATWPKEVQAIARALCRNDPVRVFIGGAQQKLVANKDITQRVQLLPSENDKLEALRTYLDTQPWRDGARVMIFTATKRTADWLEMTLNGAGGGAAGGGAFATDGGRPGGRRRLRAVAVHGDKSQGQRERALDLFRSGRVPVMVATDVAARGLDIRGVTAVVNYDFPNEIEMYIHRIGRTGRAGAHGESLTLLGPSCLANGAAEDLVPILREAEQEVPPELDRLAAKAAARAAARRGGGGYRGGGGGGGYRGHARYRTSRDSGGSGGRWGGRGESGGGGGGWKDGWKRRDRDSGGGYGDSGGYGGGSDSPRGYGGRGRGGFGGRRGSGGSGFGRAAGGDDGGDQDPYYPPSPAAKRRRSAVAAGGDEW